MAARVSSPRDWRALDQAHRDRGALITVIFAADAAETWAPPPLTGKRGRPKLYSDTLIEALLTIKVLLRLPLRAVEGFASGLARLAGTAWRVPDYSTLSLRERLLQVDLQALDRTRRRVLMVDSTGLKVFGEGEWKVRQHGTDGKRRTWKKAHLLVDRESGHVIAVEMTDNHVNDNLVLPALLPADLEGDAVLGDGAYHTRPLHRDVYARGGVLLSPPREDAVRWGPSPTEHDEPAFVFRNQQLRAIGRLGRQAWKLRSGMSRRSYVEAMMHRLKCVTGDRLAARTAERQAVELRLRCKVLNALSVSTVRIKR